MPSESMTVALVEVDARRPGRAGAGGDDDLVCGGRRLSAPASPLSDRHRVRVDEAPGAGEERAPGCGTAGCG